MSQAGAQPCPILTHSAISLQEAMQGEVPEIRAYKLGKRRWSYNQVELVLCELGEGARMLSVKQAVNMGTDNFKEEVRNSSVSFQVQLANEYRVQVHAFLCYDVPVAVEVAGSPGGSGTGSRQGEHEPHEEQYQWALVERCACQKGCSGPVLRAIQRFGKLGKRAWGTAPSPDLTDRTNNNMKDPRYFYLSFDEAGTHVGVKTFRLVVAVYDQGGRRRLSTSVSPPIRVLANNDVPTGAAHILLHAQIPSSWEGWQGVPANATDEHLFLAPTALPGPALPGLRMPVAMSPTVLSTPGSRQRPCTSDESAGLSHHSSSGADKRLRPQHLTPRVDESYLTPPTARYHHGALATGAPQPLQHQPDRRTRRRLSMDDPDYVPRRASSAAVTPTRFLPPRRHPHLDSHYAHFDDHTPSTTPTTGSLPSPGATTSNTSALLMGQQAAAAAAVAAAAQQQHGGAHSLAATFALRQAGRAGQQQQQQQQQGSGLSGSPQQLPVGFAPNMSGMRGGFGLLGNESAGEQFSLNLHNLDMDISLPQLIQSTPGGGQQVSPGTSGRFGLNLSPTTAPHLFLDPVPPGSARSMPFPLQQSSLDGSLAEDPISAFLEILMKSQAPGPGSPIVELPNLSPGGSPTKSPFRRSALLPGGSHGAASGNPPSSLSNATAFPMLPPSSPLSPLQPGAQQAQQAAVMQQQQAQQAAAAMLHAHPSNCPPHPGSLQQGLQHPGQQCGAAQQAQQGLALPPHEQLHAFGSTISLHMQQQQQQNEAAGGKGAPGCPQDAQEAQQAAAAAAAAAQQQQQGDLFFRRNPGMNLGLDPALVNARLSPMPVKLEVSLMGPTGPLDHAMPPLSPPRSLLPGADLSPLRMAHSPNSISTPTPSALDDIFNSFQPTLETAAEALMQGDSAFATPSIKPEPGVANSPSPVQPGSLFPQQHTTNSLAVQ